MVVFLDCFKVRQSHQHYPQRTKHRTQGFYFDEFIRAKSARSGAAVVEPPRRRPTPSRARVTAATITDAILGTLREEAPRSKTGFADDSPHGQMNSFSASP